MSFLLDPPLLVAAGAALERAGVDEQRARDVERAVLGVFLVTSISLYANARWTRPLWRACRASSGRDWMINSGVWSMDAGPVSARGVATAAAIFATYPSFLRLGRRLARR